MPDDGAGGEYKAERGFVEEGSADWILWREATLGLGLGLALAMAEWACKCSRWERKALARPPDASTSTHLTSPRLTSGVALTQSGHAAECVLLVTEYTSAPNRRTQLNGRVRASAGRPISASLPASALCGEYL